MEEYTFKNNEYKSRAELHDKKSWYAFCWQFNQYILSVQKEDEQYDSNSNQQFSSNVFVFYNL